MITKQFVRKVLLAGVAVGSSPVPTSIKCDQICRASELPIYMSQDDCNHKEENELLCPPKIGLIEKTLGSVRRQIWFAMDKCNTYQKQVEGHIDHCQEYAASMYKYLSHDADETTKMVAVGAGALTGVVLGLRGGIFRKLFYSGVGAYAMSAVCYPTQTANYTRQVIHESRQYATIGYNFICGVKKDDIPLQLPQLPKLPSSMDDVWEIAGSIRKSASSLISESGDDDDEVEGKVISRTFGTYNKLVEESHKSASESCHCPVGACLGRHGPEEKIEPPLSPPPEEVACCNVEPEDPKKSRLPSLLKPFSYMS